jgi:HD-like signal output (HDOD) protein
MKRVLFVDDEAHILESLRDALRPRRREWRMTFVGSGEAALAELDRQPHDVVVSDMRMPGMDGAALLAEIQRRHPGTVRIVLSGFAEMEAVARAATVAHRFLAKPCDLDELTAVVERSCALNDLTRREGLRSAATGAARLPAAPALFAELTAVLNDVTSTPRDAADVIGRDVAMAAKVLQLANSAFFGPGRQISQVDQAVVYLGLNTVKTLVLTAEAFEVLHPSRPIANFDIEELERHGAVVGRVVRRMLPDDPLRDDAVAAALLHDLGLLVLAARHPDHLADVLTVASAGPRPLVEVEREHGGVTHAEVGAHLLDLWGLAHDVAEAVAYHHEPWLAEGAGLGPAAAIYIADTLLAEHEAAVGAGAHVPGAPLDLEYVDALGVRGRLDEWRALVADECARG